MFQFQRVFSSDSRARTQVETILFPRQNSIKLSIATKKRIHLLSSFQADFLVLNCLVQWTLRTARAPIPIALHNLSQAEDLERIPMERTLRDTENCQIKNGLYSSSSFSYAHTQKLCLRKLNCSCWFTFNLSLSLWPWLNTGFSWWVCLWRGLIVLLFWLDDAGHFHLTTQQAVVRIIVYIDHNHRPSWMDGSPFWFARMFRPREFSPCTGGKAKPLNKAVRASASGMLMGIIIITIMNQKAIGSSTRGLRAGARALSLPLLHACLVGLRDGYAADRFGFVLPCWCRQRRRRLIVHRL